MNASASGAAPTPDIRVGDLVKATRKDNPEISATGRVQHANRDKAVIPIYGPAYFENWDFEVLDRPLPPIEPELLLGAVNEFRKARGFLHPTTQSLVDDPTYRLPTEAIINFVREYDRKNATKESK